MEIKNYKEYKEAEILNFYKSVGWSNYYNNPNMVKKAFENSLFIFGLYNEDELIGFIRGVGDAHSIIYIQDIIIHPLYQRKGLGSQLINRVLDEYKEVYQIVLSTDNQEKTISFYTSLGFLNYEEIGCSSFMKMNI